MKTWIRRILMVVLIAVFVFSAGNLAYIFHEYAQTDKMNEEAAELAGVPELTEPVKKPQAKPAPLGDTSGAASSEEAEETDEDPYIEVMRQIDIKALQETNPDVIGWILIPDTGVSFPVVHCDNNDYYLNYSWNRTYNAAGAIFMDYKNHADMQDFNTVIYGHRMNNGAMFGLLHQYEDTTYWEDHPRIYLALADGTVLIYNIFSASRVEINGDALVREFADDAAKEEFISYCVGRSNIYTGLVPTVEDHILTLSTCNVTNRLTTRWVVQGILWDPEAETAEDPGDATGTGDSSASAPLPGDPAANAPLPGDPINN